MASTPPSSSNGNGLNRSTGISSISSSSQTHHSDLAVHHPHDSPAPVASAATASAAPRHLDSFSLHWNDLDQPKFLGCLTAAAVAIRCALYPAALIKTRLQVHNKQSKPAAPAAPAAAASASSAGASASPQYRNMLHALTSIQRTEGIRALYRGFRFNLLGVIMDPIGVAALETTRTSLTHFAQRNQNLWWVPDSKGAQISLIAGGVNALVAQSVLVPIDIITQKLQLQTSSMRKDASSGGASVAGSSGSSSARPSGTRAFATLAVNPSASLPSPSPAPAPSSAPTTPFGIASHIMSTQGLRGFYSGYLLTLCATVPYSSLVWTLYWRVQEVAKKLLAKQKHPKHPPHETHRGAEEFESDWRELLTAPCSAAVSATAASLLTQPFDVLKVRIQVADTRPTVRQAVSKLVSESGVRGLWSGSGARVMAVMPGSVIMMSAYEGIKRNCVKEDNPAKAL